MDYIIHEEGHDGIIRGDYEDSISVTLPSRSSHGTKIYCTVRVIIPEPYYTNKTVSRWERMADGGYVYTEKPRLYPESSFRSRLFDLFSKPMEEE